MNKPDKAGEPSIEEILASIRQKNSEGAEAPRSADGGSAEALSDHPSSANASEAPRETPPALLDRLKGMGQGEAAAGAGAGALNGVRRPLSFDQDLADMFDEPDAGEPLSAAPKPEMRATSRLGGFAPAPSSEVNGSRAASTASSSSSSSSSALDASSTSSAASSASAPPPRPSYGFPPLTKQGGFYPRSEPQLPPMSGAGEATPASSDGEAVDNGGKTAPSSSPPASGPSQRFSDLGSFIPSDAVGRGVHTPRSSFGTPPLAGSGKDSLSVSSEANGVAHVIPELDADKSASGDDISAAQGTASAPLADSGPSRQKADQATSSPGASGPGATQALDALAMGLAASSAKAGADQRHNSPPDGMLKPVPDTSAAAGEPRHAVVAQDAQASSPPSRSLEDAVSDMLRPMLQQWVQENMPRIMEKALRSEMQRTLGPGGGKPPGSAS